MANYLNMLHVDQLLSRFSVMVKNPNPVAELVAPEIKVDKESDYYPVFDLSNFDLTDARRADGAESSEIEWSMSKSPYVAYERAHKTYVTDRMRKNADKPTQPDYTSVVYLKARVRNNLESDVAKLVTNTANYAAGNFQAVATKWDASGTPLNDLAEAAAQVRGQVGELPNTIIIPSEVALKLATNQQILDVTKYTHADLLTASGLPKVIKGMKVIEAPTLINTAKKGQARSLSNPYGKNVIVCYTSEHPGLYDMTFAGTFRTGMYVKKWRVEERAADAIEYSDIYDPQVICNGAGFLLQNVIS